MKDLRAELDDFERRWRLINKVFNDISGICIRCEYKLTDEDWRVLDEARLDDAISYEDLRKKLKAVYLRVMRNALRKKYGQTSQSSGTDVLDVTT
jgi:hypothetical protein